MFLGGTDPVATDRGLSGMNLGGTVLAVAAGRKTAGGGRRLVSGGSVGLRRSVKNGRMRGLEVDVAEIVSPSPTASNGDSVKPAGNTIQRSAVIVTAVTVKIGHRDSILRPEKDLLMLNNLQILSVGNRRQL